MCLKRLKQKEISKYLKREIEKAKKVQFKGISGTPNHHIRVN